MIRQDSIGVALFKNQRFQYGDGVTTYDLLMLYGIVTVDFNEDSGVMIIDRRLMTKGALGGIILRQEYISVSDKIEMVREISGDFSIHDDRTESINFYI